MKTERISERISNRERGTAWMRRGKDANGKDETNEKKYCAHSQKDVSPTKSRP